MFKLVIIYLKLIYTYIYANYYYLKVSLTQTLPSLLMYLTAQNSSWNQYPSNLLHPLSILKL